MGRRWFDRRSDATLGLNSGTFRDVEVGCLGAVLLVVFTAGAMFGLVAMVWWLVWKNQGAGP